MKIPMNCAVVISDTRFSNIPARVYLLVCLFKGLLTFFQQFISLSLNSHLLPYLFLAIQKTKNTWFSF